MSDRGRYRRIFTSLWLDPRFLGLTDAEKIVCFYLLTGPMTNRIGLYRLSPSTAAEDLETSVEAFRKRLATVSTTFSWLFDAKARVLWIPNWLTWNPPANDNVMRGSLKDLRDLPPCGLMAAFTRNIEAVPEDFRESFVKGLHEAFPSGFPNQEQYPDQDLSQEQETRKSATKRRTARSAPTPTAQPDPTSAKLDTIVREAKANFHKDDDLESQLDTCRSYGLAHGLDDIPRAMWINALARVGAVG